MTGLVVNVSVLLADLPFAERLEGVRRAGLDAVECWWPFAAAEPDAAEVDAFVADIAASGLELVAMNLYAGDMPGGERGVLSLPGRTAELAASARIAADIGGRLGVRRFNALYGNRIGERDEEQDAVAIEALRTIAPDIAAIDGTILIEPVSGVAAYPLRSAADVEHVVRRAHEAGATRVAALLDLYHLAVLGDDVEAVVDRAAATAGHVQIADAPGRGLPGSGDLPLLAWARRLRDRGYTGRIALECTGSLDDLTSTALAGWKDLA